jgi:hypothetical protein
MYTYMYKHILNKNIHIYIHIGFELGSSIAMASLCGGLINIIPRFSKVIPPSLFGLVVSSLLAIGLKLPIRNLYKYIYIHIYINMYLFTCTHIYTHTGDPSLSIWPGRFIITSYRVKVAY